MFLLLTVILVLLLIFVAITIFKKVIKVALILIVVFVVLFLITGGSIFSDLGKLKERVSQGNNYVFLQSGNEIITGFTTDDKHTLTLEADISKDETSFTYDLEIFSDFETKINNKAVKGQEIIDFYTINKRITQITYEDLALDLDLYEEDMKYALFVYLYENELKITKSPVFFFKNYKEGKIGVEPETIFFKFARVMPLGFIDANLNKLKDTIDEKRGG